MPVALKISLTLSLLTLGSWAMSKLYANSYEELETFRAWSALAVIIAFFTFVSLLFAIWTL